MRRTITIDTNLEPFRTEIEHLADGTVSIRQHAYEVTRDENGVEIGRSAGFVTTELSEEDADQKQLPALKAFVDSIPAQAKAAADAAATIDAEPAPVVGIIPVPEPISEG